MYIQISIVFLSRICINYNNCNILCYDLLRGSSLPFPSLPQSPSATRAAFWVSVTFGLKIDFRL